MGTSGHQQLFKNIEQIGLLSVLFTIEAFWIFISNAATILTFATNKKIYHKAAYSLINLAVSDIFYGVFIACYYNFAAYAVVLTHEMFLALETMKVIAGISSATCLALVALERVYATYLPFRHRTTGSKTWVIAIAITWGFPIFISTSFLYLPSGASNIIYYVTLSCVLASLLAIILSYVAIFIKVKSQNQIHHNQQRSIPAAELRKRNVAYTVLLVTVLSFVTWIPFLVLMSVNARGSSTLALHLAALVQASNSFINPIIYVIRIKEFRKALVRMLCFRSCGRTRHQHVDDIQRRSQRAIQTSTV